MRIFKASFRDRHGNLRKSAKWYCEFRDARYTVRRLAGFTDKKNIGFEKFKQGGSQTFDFIFPADNRSITY